MKIQEQLWDFPCQHTLKIMGPAQYPLAEIVVEVLSKYAPDFDPTDITFKNSGKGKYLSVSAPVLLTDKEQVEAIYKEFAERDEISWVL